MKVLIKTIILLYSKIKILNYKRKMDLLISKGLKLGKNVTIMPSVVIDDGYSFLISIGDNCSISSGTIILAHDATTFKFTNGYAKVGKVEIKDNCFIGSNVIILPGVTIGPNVLISAGSVVNKDIPPNSCVAGIPARVYEKFDEFIKHHVESIQERPSFEFKEFISPNDEFKEKIRNLVEMGNIYVKGYRHHFPWTITWKK